MPTYVSRHNPRKQLVILGERIASAETYDRYYDIGWEAFERGVLPVLRLQAGRLLFRYSGANIEQSRTLRQAEFSSNSRGVRYSGVRLTGQEGQGALYMASLGGVARERVHYAGATAGGGLILPGSTDQTRAAVKALAAGPALAVPGGPLPFHVYRLQTALLLADIRVMALVRVFQNLLASPGARARFGVAATATAAGMMNNVLAPQDYSAARGLADAVFDGGGKRGIAGLMATSARGDSDSGVILDNQGDGVEGLVYALFGKAEERLDALQPVASYGSFKQMRDAAKALPGFSWVA